MKWIYFHKQKKDSQFFNPIVDLNKWKIDQMPYNHLKWCLSIPVVVFNLNTSIIYWEKNLNILLLLIIDWRLKNKAKNIIWEEKKKFYSQQANPNSGPSDNTCMNFNQRSGYLMHLAWFVLSDRPEFGFACWKKNFFFLFFKYIFGFVVESLINNKY